MLSLRSSSNHNTAHGQHLQTSLPLVNQRHGVLLTKQLTADQAKKSPAMSLPMEWVEVELPTTITAAYTIPTPVKDNDEFIGWYDNNNGTGTALTVLPVGYKGTVYAIWKSMNTSTDVENIRPALDVNAPMYDVLGRQVDTTYRGIIIQNGNKYLLR